MRDTAGMAARTPLLMGVVWLAGAVTATAVGTFAVQRVARSVGDAGTAPLSVGQVQHALSAVPSAAPRDTPGARPAGAVSTIASPRGVGAVRTFVTDAGVLGAQCRGSNPVVIYASPESGYRTERSAKEGRAVVRFVGSEESVQAVLTCREGAVQVAVTTVRTPVSSNPPRPRRTVPAATPVPTRSEPDSSPEPSDRPEPEDPGHS